MKKISNIFLSLTLLLYSITLSAVTETQTVITSFYPMYIMAANILKNIPDVRLMNLTNSQIGCLHDYQLTASDVKLLETGNILIVNGAGMESFLAKVIAQYPRLPIITATNGIALLPEVHHKGEFNPHVWVSVSFAIKEVQNISKELQNLIPKQREAIVKNSTEYVFKLEQLKTKMHQRLSQLKHRKIITFHEAFPYFAQEFNLNIIDVIESGPGQEPSAKELKDIIEKIKKLKINVLFAEPQYSSKIAHTIAKETKSKVYFLDPIVTGKFEHDAYIKTMEQNLLVLESALK